MNTYLDFPEWPKPGYGWVYFLRSPTGQGYVGQTRMPVSKRVKFHTSRGGCRILHGAIVDHGIGSFFVGIVGHYPLRELNEAETRFVRELETLHPLGYNLTTGGGPRSSCSHSTRQKMSATRKGIPHTPEWNKRLAEANRGLRRSDEARQKMSRAHKGVPLSEDHRRGLSKARKGIPRKPFSAEWKQHLSDARRAYVASQKGAQ
jgi:group I intron endonuclease